jgi:outer membrane protein assembly factor BamB
MNRDQLRKELPEPVRRYFEEVARMEPPTDLMHAAIKEVEAQPRGNRFSWLPALVAVAATALIAAVIAFNVFGLDLFGPLVGTDATPTAQGSPTPKASATEPPIQTVPPLAGLPSAGDVEARYSVSPDAGDLALVAFGTVWLTNGQTGVVTGVDADSGAITQQIDVNPNPETDRYDQNLIADESFLWATGADQTLVKIDPIDGTVLERIDIGRLIYRMALRGDDIWITSLDITSSVVRVDSNTGEVTFNEYMSGWPGGLAATDDSVWVTPYQQGRLVRLDPDTGAPITEFPVGRFGMNMVANGDVLYISGNQERPLERFSISEGRVTARFGSETFVGLLDGRLYSTHEGALIALDPDTLEVTAALDIGAGAGGGLPPGVIGDDGFVWLRQGDYLVKVRPAP